MLPDFEIAVFAANEAPRLAGCVASVDRACAGHRAQITVVLNGTRDNGLEVLRGLRPVHAGLRAFRIPEGDKANAINTFLHELRGPADAYVQIDAYARITPPTLRALRDALEARPEANIASAVQASGRSAAAQTVRTLKGGVVNGQCHALRPSFVDRMVAAGLRLPVRLYRGDGLLGSMAAHDLDALGTPWDDGRVAGVAEAQFAIAPLSVWRWRDLQRQYRREIRQARGALENAAIKAIIYQRGYAALPDDADTMIRDWIAAHPPHARSLWHRHCLGRTMAALDGRPFSAGRGEWVL